MNTSKSGKRHYQCSESERFISMIEVLNASILVDGCAQRVRDAKPQDFRAWLYSTIDACVAVVGNANHNRQRGSLLCVKREARKHYLDDDARWYLINELYRLRCFRDSGVVLFVENEKVAV